MTMTIPTLEKKIIEFTNYLHSKSYNYDIDSSDEDYLCFYFEKEGGKLCITLEFVRDTVVFTKETKEAYFCEDIAGYIFQDGWKEKSLKSLNACKHTVRNFFKN